MSTFHLAILIVATPILASLVALVAPLFASPERQRLQGVAASVSVIDQQPSAIAQHTALSRLRASIDGARPRFQSRTVPPMGENIPGAGQ